MLKVTVVVAFPDETAVFEAVRSEVMASVRLESLRLVLNVTVDPPMLVIEDSSEGDAPVEMSMVDLVEFENETRVVEEPETVPAEIDNVVEGPDASTGRE